MPCSAPADSRPPVLRRARGQVPLLPLTKLGAATRDGCRKPRRPVRPEAQGARGHWRPGPLERRNGWDPSEWDPPHPTLKLISIAGWPEASQPPAPTDPHVSLSTHTARVVQLYQGSAQCLQCTNSSGSLVRTPRNHVRARGPLRSSRLYFHLAHRTRWRSMRRQSGTTALG